MTRKSLVLTVAAAFVAVAVVFGLIIATYQSGRDRILGPAVSVTAPVQKKPSSPTGSAAKSGENGASSPSASGDDGEESPSPSVTPAPTRSADEEAPR